MFEENLRGRYDARKTTEPRSRYCLGMFGHRRLADDCEQGDDVETPSRCVRCTVRKPFRCHFNGAYRTRVVELVDDK